MNLAELDALLKTAGHPGLTGFGRTSFRGASMATIGDRDEEKITNFSSEDAMCRWLLARELVRRAPRTGAVLQPTLVTRIDGPARWQIAYPQHSMLRARGNGMLAILDTSGLALDPHHGAPQITILDSATGTVRATWVPPHGAMWSRFENDTLIIDDGKERATECDVLTGHVIGPTQAGVREKWTEPLLPHALHRSRDVSRLESRYGALLWTRPGWVRPAARAHNLSIINTAEATLVEAVRDDGTSAWSLPGIPATVTADTVWVDAGTHLVVVDTATGQQLSSTPVPWSGDKLHGLHNGWNPRDGVVVITDDIGLSVYPQRIA